jgi:Na+/melibiose symporter-like transporter
MYRLPLRTGPLVAHTRHALQRVRIGVALLPVIMLVPSVLPMWNFPLDERRHGILRRRLERRAAASPAAA